jgi:hypothetical protein
MSHANEAAPLLGQEQNTESDERNRSFACCNIKTTMIKWTLLGVSILSCLIYFIVYYIYIPKQIDDAMGNTAAEFNAVTISALEPLTALTTLTIPVAANPVFVNVEIGEMKISMETPDSLLHSEIDLAVFDFGDLPIPPFTTSVTTTNKFIMKEINWPWVSWLFSQASAHGISATAISA